MNTLDALVDRLFDYAGMFPPAALGFDEALREAAAHPGALRRPRLVDTDMVLQAKYLERITPEALEAVDWPHGKTCTIALVGIPLDAAEETLERVQGFNRDHAQDPTPSRITSVEPTTESRLDDAERDAVQASLLTLKHGLGDDTRLFLEPRWRGDTWATGGADLFELLGSLRTEHPVGLKIRCAGETAIPHPTMADLLPHITTRGLPLKATQGLHHPLIEEQRNNQWGFINLTTALRFVGTHGTTLPVTDLLALLKETDPKAFHFDDRLAWRGHEIHPDELKEAATSVPFSIGSCSIHEPDQDLARLFG